MKFDFELNQKCTTANGFVTYCGICCFANCYCLLNALHWLYHEIGWSTVLNINIKYVNWSGIVPDLLKRPNNDKQR